MSILLNDLLSVFSPSLQRQLSGGSSEAGSDEGSKEKVKKKKKKIKKEKEEKESDVSLCRASLINFVYRPLSVDR